MAISANAITLYVYSTTAPFIWSWNSSDGVDYNQGTWPGTLQFTEKETVQGIEFWKYSFPESVTKISFQFNDGAATDTKKTADINGVTNDRYYTWDGGSEYEDITEQITGQEDPDAEITSVTLTGNHNGWGDGDPFTAVEAGKVYTITQDMTGVTVEEGLWKFKFRPNGYWVGYPNVTLDEAPAWLTEATSDGNFQIDLDEGTTERVFTFIATWGGGKKAEENWTFKATAGASGINTLKTVINSKDAPIYNLQGQRVDGNYRGIAIQNGRKVVVK